MSWHLSGLPAKIARTTAPIVSGAVPDGETCMGLTATQKELRADLAALSDRVRSPFLPLHYFTASTPPEPDFDEATGREVYRIPKREEPNARLRRGAVMLAAQHIFDECAADLAFYE